MKRLLPFLAALSLHAFPLPFEFHQGVYTSRGVQLTPTGPVFRGGVRMTLAGGRVSNPTAAIAGRATYLARDGASYFPLAGEVRYPAVYPGIDLLFRDGREYDFLLAPGADPSTIRLRFEGAHSISLDGGDLVVDGLRHRRPLAYQGQKYIPAAYRLHNGDVTFQLGPYDRTLPLVIDPVLTYATYAGGSGAETGNAIAVDSAGNAYLAGNTDSPDFMTAKGATAPRAFLLKLDPAGAKALATFVLGGATVDALAIDGAGNLVLAGAITTAAQFPGATTGAYTAGATGYVARLTQSTSGFQIGFISTFSAAPSSIAFDSTGAIYVAGSASSAFQTTAGSVQPAIHSGTDAFVLKLAPDGSKAVYATFLGGRNTDTARAIAVDSGGAAYIAGDTLSSDFPTTPGAFQTKFGGFVAGDFTDYGDAFIAKLDPAGAQLLFSTYIGGAQPDIAYAIALDKQGNAYIAGGTQSADFPVTAGVYQTKYAGGTLPADAADPAGDIFIAKFSSSGARVWSTFLGGNGRDLAEAIALDSAGNVYLAGASDSPDFPFTAGAIRGCRAGGPWIAELDPNGAKLLNATSISGLEDVDEPHALALDSAGAVYLAGDVISRVFFAGASAYQKTYAGGEFDAFAARVDLTAGSRLMAACVLNGASFLAGNAGPFRIGSVAPGEFVSIFGAGLGPDTGLIAQPNDQGFPDTLGGTQVFFDGVPATILYSSAKQINAIVPYGIKGPATQMTVQRGGITDGPHLLPVAPAVPGIFTANSAGTLQAAVLNQDFSYNSPANPANRGDVIVFYAVGAGAMTPPQTDGSISPQTLPLPAPQLPVAVSIRGVDARVVYAGAAPGYVTGLLQVNVVVPDAVGFGNSLPLTLSIGGQQSQFNVTIAVKQ